MPAPNNPDKPVGKEPKPKKLIEYRRFEEVLKKVIKAPPMRRNGDHK